MDHRKIYTVYFDSPCQALSNGGLGFVVALLVCPGINFVCAYLTANPAVWLFFFLGLVESNNTVFGPLFSLCLTLRKVSISYLQKGHYLLKVCPTTPPFQKNKTLNVK